MQVKQLAGGIVPHGTGHHFNLLGHSITKVFANEATGGAYYVFEVVTPPGLGLPMHVHDREDEIIYVVEGEFEIFLGDKRFIAKAGDNVFFPRGLAHAFQNAGSKAAKAIFTVSPGASFEAFFDKLAALPPGPPDMKRIIEIFAAHGMQVLLPQPT
ncbi:MAG TPA: cupin domain-containing protein [Flavisolibacter sp.]